MAYQAIKNQLVTILQGVSSIKKVYGREEKLIDQFPAACVSAKDHVSAYQTVGSGGGNKRIYQHYIRLYFRTDETNDPDFEDVLESTADAVITALEHNVQVANVWDYAI